MEETMKSYWKRENLKRENLKRENLKRENLKRVLQEKWIFLGQPLKERAS